MIFESNNFSIITKELYNDLIDDSDKKTYYLYHYIIVAYQENTIVKTIKIDQLKDLDKIKVLNVLNKYYITKVHYYTEPSNMLLDGMPTYVYNIGYFLLDGDVDTTRTDKEEFEKLLKDYNDNYSNMKFPYDDTEFLSLNKSIINF